MLRPGGRRLVIRICHPLLDVGGEIGEAKFGFP